MDELLAKQCGSVKIVGSERGGCVGKCAACRPGRFQSEVFGFLCLVYAMCVGWATLTPVLLAPLAASEFATSDNAERRAFVMYSVGWMLGGYGFGELADRHGRRRTATAGLFLGSVSLVGMGLASGWGQLLFAQLLLGFFVGGAGTSSYAAAVELTPAVFRTALVTTKALAWSGGSIVLAALAYGITLEVPGSNGWRLICFVAALPMAVAAALCAVWMPETPLWSLSRGEHSEAQTTLRRIARKNGARVIMTATGSTLALTLPRGHLERRLRSGKGGSGGLWRCLEKEMRSASLVCWFCWSVVTFAYYGLAFSAGHMSGSAYSTQVALATVDVPALLVGFVVLECIGRRKALVLFSLVGGCAMVPLAFLDDPSAMKDGTNTASTAVMVLASVGRYCLASIWPILYLLAAELPPTELRATFFGGCTLFARLAAIFAPIFVEKLQFKWTMLVYGICLLAMAWLARTLPETALRPLEAEGVAQRSYATKLPKADVDDDEEMGLLGRGRD